MKHRHRYEYKLDINGSSAPATVVRMVGQKKKVLEMGAGPGSISRILKEHNNCKITAIELDQEAIKKLFPFCEQVYQCDLNDQAWTSILPLNRKFDTIVAADVLEHLANPRATLISLKEILEPHGTVIVSLPHIKHSAAVACLSQDGFELQDWGLLDKTHIQFFDIDKIQQLFEDTGFKIIDAEFIVIPPEQTELAYFWRRIPNETKVDLKKDRFSMVYQVVIKATSGMPSQDGLKLSSLTVPVPISNSLAQGSIRVRVLNSIKKNILPYLHPHTRQRIRDILYIMGLRF
jgi:2-polyprenyl-3-methyl-5-hydroxy-6-metoxy-1,4-benzoquinol methylase